MNDNFEYRRNAEGIDDVFPKLNFLSISVSMLCIIIVTLSFFYEVEMITISEGTIIPKSDIMYVNSAVGGVISEVYVENGQYIKYGSKILRYDFSKEKNRLEDYKSENEILRIQLNEITRIITELFLQGNESIPLAIDVSMFDKAEYLYKANRLVDLAISKIIAYEYEHDQNKLKSSIYESKIISIESEAKEFSKLISMDSDLVDKGLINKRDFKERVHRYKLLNIELDRANKELYLSRQQLKNYNQRIEIVKNELLSQLEDIRFDIIQKMNNLKREILWNENIVQNEVLFSRMSGYVTDIRANIDGNFISEGEILLKIVPKDNEFRIKAYISNSNIGFVILGQEVRVRVDAFNYNRYGYLEGRVLYISNDAKYIDGGEFYELIISLNNNVSELNERDIKLMSGLSVKADIITGRRSVASYFLYPIYDALNYSLIER
ncbi:HlyD family efflux transporter periplasmic adaptor subunit [Vibrio cholerae]